MTNKAFRIIDIETKNDITFEVEFIFDALHDGFFVKRGNEDITDSVEIIEVEYE